MDGEAVGRGVGHQSRLVKRRSVRPRRPWARVVAAAGAQREWMPSMERPLPHACHRRPDRAVRPRGEGAERAWRSRWGILVSAELRCRMQVVSMKFLLIAASPVGRRPGRRRLRRPLRLSAFAASGGCVGKVLLPPKRKRAQRARAGLARSCRAHLHPGACGALRPSGAGEFRRGRSAYASPRSTGSSAAPTDAPGPTRWVHEPDRYGEVAEHVLVTPGHYVWEQPLWACSISGRPQPGQTVVTTHRLDHVQGLVSRPLRDGDAPGAHCGGPLLRRSAPPCSMS